MARGPDFVHAAGPAGPIPALFAATEWGADIVECSHRGGIGPAGAHGKVQGVVAGERVFGADGGNRLIRRGFSGSLPINRSVLRENMRLSSARGR